MKKDILIKYAQIVFSWFYMQYVKTFFKIRMRKSGNFVRVWSSAYRGDFWFNNPCLSPGWQPGNSSSTMKLPWKECYWIAYNRIKKKWPNG
ncbi:MAG: hypothetical protein RL641_440 [Candidatus Parcubacteria bacterium]|jgi:hypothetical protein